MHGTLHKPVLRRYTFKLYPNAGQLDALERQRRMHCDLYNGLLQQRIDHYRHEVERHGKSARGLTYFDQCKHLTALRHAIPEWAELSYTSKMRTAKRLDDAYKAFFRRAKQGLGHQSGFPKYKSSRYYPGVPFGKPKTGWNIEFHGKSGSAYFQAVPGRVKLRGKFPSDPLKIKTCDLLWRDERWWASLVVEIHARREAGSGKAEVEFDLVDSFARVSRANGVCGAGPEDVTDFVMADGRITVSNQMGYPASVAESAGLGGDNRFDEPLLLEGYVAESADLGGDNRPNTGPTPVRRVAGSADLGGDNRHSLDIDAARAVAGSADLGGDNRTPDLDIHPRIVAESADKVAALQARRANTKRGSNKYRRLSRQITILQGNAARRRKDALHNWTTALAASVADVTIVAPESIKDATASGSGDEHEWGAAVKTKATLNRAVLDQAPAAAIAMLEYKIAEGGGTAEVVKRKDHKVEIGAAVVKAGKSVRRARRAVKRKKELVDA